MYAKSMNASKEKIAAVCTAAGFFACAFSQGGFFFQNTIFTYLLFAITFVLLVKKIDYRANVLFFVAMLLLATSLAFTKGDFQSGLYEVQKTMLFFIALSIGTSYKKSNSIMKTVFVSAFAVAALGIFAYCFNVTENDLVLFDRYLYRLQSVFGYANTTAVFLGCGYFAFLSGHESGKKAYEIPMALCILTALYLTVSKAGIPLFLVIGTLYICKIKNHRGVFIYHNVFSAVGALLIAEIAATHAHMLAILVFLLLIFLGTLLRFKEKPIYYKAWVCLAVVATVGAIVFICIKPSLLSTLVYRFLYMGDSLNLLAESKLFGNGPASWRVLQYGVQSVAYSVSHIHNGYLEFAVEVGLPFALLFIFVLVFAIVCASKKRDMISFSMLLLISLHAFIDTDFSFAAILILAGFICGNVALNCGKGGGLRCIITSVAVFAVTVLVFGYMLCEVCVRGQMEHAYSNGDFDGAYKYALKLEKIVPRDSGLKVTLAAIEEKAGHYQNVPGYLEKAIELSPNDHKIYGDYMQYVSNGETLGDMCMTYIEKAPMREETYTFLSSLVERELNEGRIEKTEAEIILRDINAKRTENGVIDRNTLLNEITQSGEVK